MVVSRPGNPSPSSSDSQRPGAWAISGLRLHDRAPHRGKSGLMTRFFFFIVCACLYLLARISTALNEVKGREPRRLRLSSKPPSTIEWE